MPIEFIEHNSGRDVEIVATGKLEVEDYDAFVPRFDNLIEKFGSIDVLFVMKDFGGFEMWALWEDIKLEWKHYANIGRLGMVGETSWEEWMATFCKPFTKSEIKYFDSSDISKARSWVAME